MPLALLMCLFIVVPIAEISLLIKVGNSIGGWQTIGFVILTAILGAFLVRQQGLATLLNVQKETQAGRLPAMQIMEGVLLLFAGAVLLTPGFMTDALGFSLLVPRLRQSLIAWIAKQGFVHAQTHTTYHQGAYSHSHGHKNDPTIIEGEYKKRDA